MALMRCESESSHSPEGGTRADLNTGGSCSGPAGRRGRTRITSRATAIATAGLAILVIAACGSSSSSTSSLAASGGSSATSPAGANTAAASAAIAPYIGHPSAFPVNLPLNGKLPAGTTFAFLQCGSPICGLVSQLLAPAVHAVGANLRIINAGSTASSAQGAAASALSLKPAAVLIIGIVPSEYGGGLKKLSDAGIKVVSISVAGPTKPYGITFNYVGLPSETLSGRELADWVIVHKGPEANVAFYAIPEVAFTPYMEAAFKQELAKNCPSCKVRFVPVDITSIGTKAPQTVVNDLQAHPSTNYMVFAPAEAAQGLPAAMKSAGLSVPDVSYTPEPQELQDIKTGGMTAGFASDLPTQIWTWVDVTARSILGQPPTAGEVAGSGPFQFLSQKDITFDPAKGWTGYPDFAQRFAKLWHAS